MGTELALKGFLGLFSCSGFHRLHDLFPRHRVRSPFRPSLDPCRSRFWAPVSRLFRHIPLLDCSDEGIGSIDWGRDRIKISRLQNRPRRILYRPFI